jgi:hypothetical protein
LPSITIDAEDFSLVISIGIKNHFTETGKIRAFRPLAKNDKSGVQVMEMLEIYFAMADNQQINRIVSSHRKKHLIINIRSDYKTNVGQL